MIFMFSDALTRCVFDSCGAFKVKVGSHESTSWRHDFGGSIKYGDLYYDLAKIQHGLIVSHDKVSKQKFYVNQKNDNVSIRISKPNIYKIYLKLFKIWLIIFTKLFPYK